jgi:hypothetical protein
MVVLRKPDFGASIRHQRPGRSKKSTSWLMVQIDVLELTSQAEYELKNSRKLESLLESVAILYSLLQLGEEKKTMKGDGIETV